jgi:drug/metabolite transporter (DMT)-like permease
VIGQLEPAGSAAMAVVLFGEIPQPIQLIGSLVVILGVVLAIIGQRDTV